MRRILVLTVAVAGASAADRTLAYSGILADFDDPSLNNPESAPLPADYLGQTWEQDGGADGLGWWYGNYDWYNVTFGASLATISGPNFGFNSGGDADTIVWLATDMLLNSAYFTPWLGFGGPSMSVRGWLDGAMVYDSGPIPLVDNEWTFFDFGSALVDEIHFLNSSGGTGEWWLVDDLLLKKIPAPGSLALLALAGLAAGRRRRE